MVTMVHPATPVERAVAALLVENTGSNMLDSGGAYGRAWQWTRAKYGLDGGLPNSKWHGGPGHNPVEPRDDDIERVALAMREEPAGEIDSYGMVSVDTFHYLVERLDYEPELDAKFRRFVDKLWAARDRIDWPYETGAIERFIIGLRAHGADVEINESDNSYNHDNAIDRTIQYTIFTVRNPIEWNGEIHAMTTDSIIGPVAQRLTEFLPDGGYVALQIHGGADVRGGYTDAHLFTISEPWPFGDINRMDIYCEGADLVPGGQCPGQLTMEGEILEAQHVNHYWDNSYGDSWLRNETGEWGGCYPKPDGERVLVFLTEHDDEDELRSDGVKVGYGEMASNAHADIAKRDDEGVWRCPFDESPLHVMGAVVS